MKSVLMETDIKDYPVTRGKVRDIYDLGDERLIIIATDRISAFDVVMKNGIPDKGRILTALSLFWPRALELMPKVFNLPTYHLVSTNLNFLPECFKAEELKGRVMVCRKTKPLPIECVVRGHLAGSAWKEYQETGKVCGIKLDKGLKQCQQLVDPIFTPATKAEIGHDENINFEQVIKLLGKRKAWQIRAWSMQMYSLAYDFAREKGLIISDTKFEFGLFQGLTLLIDEVLTPDSSRFWPADKYEPGRDQESFDKQFVRNYLEELCQDDQWNKKPPGLKLPSEIVSGTTKRYQQLHRFLIGKELAPE